VQYRAGFAILGQDREALPAPLRGACGAGKSLSMQRVGCGRRDNNPKIIEQPKSAAVPLEAAAVETEFFKDCVRPCEGPAARLKSACRK